MRLISSTRRLQSALLFFLLLPVIAFSQVSANSRSYKISEFAAAIEVHEDGSADVLERITFVFFGEYYGIHRYIPVSYPGLYLTNYKLLPKVRTVTEAISNKLTYR